MSAMDSLNTLYNGVYDVYNSGRLAVLKESKYMHADINGSNISVNDVSNIGHNLDVKVESKNLIPYEYANTTKTEDGITFKVNNDCSITVDGTDTGGASFYLTPWTITEDLVGALLEDGQTYTFTSGSNVLRMILHCREIETNKDVYYYNATFTVDKSKYLYCHMRIQTAKGTTYNNLTLYPQLEKGTTATSWTPYIPNVSGVTVSRYGKNLVDESARYIQSGTIIKYYKDNGFLMRKGVTYSLSISNDNEIISSMGTNTPTYTMYILQYPSGEIIKSLANSSNTGIRELVYTPPEDVFCIFQIYSTVYENGVYLVQNSKLQVEINTAHTDYEPYKAPQTATATANAGGTVEGLTSLSPNMTLISDTDGVNINCKYYRDIDRYIDNLNVAVALTGGVAE